MSEPITIVQVSTSFGHLTVELDSPVIDEDEALEVAIKKIRDDSDYWDIYQTM